jgi:microcompartment protein CcmL/EutN
MNSHTSKKDSLGFLETVGFVNAVNAADTMLKTADVELLSNKKTGSGFVSLIIKGDIGAVKAATDAGAARLKRSGNPVTTLIIQTPDSQLVKIL